MKDWKSYKAETVLKGKDEEGNRLIIGFSSDFEKRMGYKLDISCPKCFNRDFIKYLNNEVMPENKKCGFKLKPMYNGISLGFGSREFLSDHNITDELATKFANEHPKGVGLFSEVPEGFEVGEAARERFKELDALKRSELNTLAASDEYKIQEPEKLPNKTAVIEKIIQVESAND